MARGQVFTVTAEFGPPPYMQTRPFSGERDADLVEVNGWMRDRLETWFRQEREPQGRDTGRGGRQGEA